MAAMVARADEMVNAIKRRRIDLSVLPDELGLNTLGNMRLAAVVSLLDTAKRLENRQRGEPFQEDLDFLQTRGLLVNELNPARHLKTIAALIAIYKYLYGRWEEVVKVNPWAVPVHWWVLGAMFDYHIIVLEEDPEVLKAPLREFLGGWTNRVTINLPRLKGLPPRGKRWLSLVVGLVKAMLDNEA